MSTMQVSRKHHYVPKLLLRPWVVESKGQHNLHGYYWDSRHKEVRIKSRGLDSFCFQLDLLALHAHNLGVDAIERIFFGEIDTKGADVVRRLIENGADGLTGDQRCDFARLLFSLDARRPHNVAKLKEIGASHFASDLDNDSEILMLMKAEEGGESPSVWCQKHTGIFLEDKALSIIQGLVDNPKVGGKLINAFWHVVRLEENNESLILSDRPLIRKHGYDHPGAAWFLPLTPRIAFVAVNHEENLKRIQEVSLNQFAKKCNVDSISQAEKFIFSIDQSHQKWVGKYLRNITPYPIKVAS